MAKKTPGVAFYGKVRIPTIGHRAAIDQAKALSKTVGGKLTVGLSGTAEPLDLKTKKAHAEKVFGHPVETGQEHTKTLASFLTHLHKSHDHLHLVAGSDRVDEYKRFLGKYNGKPDKSGKVPFNFKSWQVHAAGGERVESNKDPRKMSRAELTSSVSASKLEKLAKEGKWDHFKAYHPDMPESHVRRVYTQIRKHHSLTEEIGLTLARKEMPQIGAAKSFMSYLKSNGVDSQLKTINPQNLKSSQMEFDDTKIEALRDSPSSNPIIVSNDDHVLDGHHRWMADKLEGRDSKAYVCDLPILDLMYHAKHYSKNLTEDVTRKELAPMLDSFVSFASKKLGIESLPKVRYKTDEDDYNSFAAYNPSSNELSVSTKNRHPMDVFRSVAHELVHHKQNEEGRIGKDIAKEGETGSDIENEANAEAGKIMRWFAKENPKMFASKHIVEETITEGINDPGKLKAIFLAGGPGSGKDFVMNSVLQGEGLREINSDTAFEYLMKKNNLDMEMPAHEKFERDIARGRAKTITKEKERLSLAGRLGLIVNGTADDVEKIKAVKRQLEDLGYETMMVFVNTSNDVSRQRNVERGKSGGRKVSDGTDKMGIPDGTQDIRQQKWEAAQKNIGELQKVFGNDKFAVIDNSVDVRKASEEEKTKVLADFDRVRRMAQQFVRAENMNPKSKEWIANQSQKIGIQYQEPNRYKTLSQVRQGVHANPTHKPDNEVMAQARRLGLSYYGFGRFGRKVKGKNHVLYHSKGNQLVRANMNEEKKPCWKGYEAIGMKKKNGRKVPNCVPVSEGQEEVKMSKVKKGGNFIKKKVKKKLAENINTAFDAFLAEKNGNKPTEREEGTNSLVKVYKQMTPGEAENRDGVGQELEANIKIVSNAPAGGSIYEWANNPKTQKKFQEKYGDLWEQKLTEAAIRLEEAGCNCDKKLPKSIKKIAEDWQKVNRKDKTDGLSQKAVNAYRRENPGSKLKTAVTEKNPKGKRAARRKSFCSRMGGMKKRLTSAKTARDPNSRINKALRRWNCEE
jgi:hypothetical protein